jgi:hypothetical protein
LGVRRQLSLFELGQKFGMAGKEPCNDGGADKCQHYKQRRSNAVPMSTHKFASAITDCVRPRTDGLVSQMSLQVVSKGFDRGVALLRILFQRLRDNRVEVTAQ